MIVFTILGVLVYWLIMGCIGYVLAMCWDIYRGTRAMFKPVDDAMAEIVAMITAMSDRHK